MKSQLVPSSRKEPNLKKELDFFLTSCEQLLIRAARDLASLRKYDIKANLIVSLSLSCEKLQRLNRLPKLEKEDYLHIGELCRDLLLGLENICHRAKQIDENQIKKREYDLFRLKLNYWWQILGTKF